MVNSLLVHNMNSVSHLHSPTSSLHCCYSSMIFFNYTSHLNSLTSTGIRRLKKHKQKTPKNPRAKHGNFSWLLILKTNKKVRIKTIIYIFLKAKQTNKQTYKKPQTKPKANNKKSKQNKIKPQTKQITLHQNFTSQSKEKNQRVLAQTLNYIIIPQMRKWEYMRSGILLFL